MQPAWEGLAARAWGPRQVGHKKCPKNGKGSKGKVCMLQQGRWGITKLHVQEDTQKGRGTRPGQACAHGKAEGTRGGKQTEPTRTMCMGNHKMGKVTGGRQAHKGTINPVKVLHQNAGTNWG